jgi:hypothetical protein
MKIGNLIATIEIDFWFARHSASSIGSLIAFHKPTCTKTSHYLFPDAAALARLPLSHALLM